VLLVPVLAATVSVWWSAQRAEPWLRSWRGRTARPVFTARCQAIERAVTKAQALPPFPDTTGHQRLTSMLTEARTGVALCLRAFAEGNGRLLLDASTHYEAALAAGRDFVGLLGDYVAQAGAAVGK